MPSGQQAGEGLRNVDLLTWVNRQTELAASPWMIGREMVGAEADTGGT